MSEGELHALLQELSRLQNENEELRSQVTPKVFGLSDRALERVLWFLIILMLMIGSGEDLTILLRELIVHLGH